MTYSIRRFFSGPMGEIETITHLPSGLVVPTDEANTDYQAYLEWLEEGNTALVVEADA